MVSATTLNAPPSIADATILPAWMRRALYATAAMNVVGAIGFLPPAHALRALAGLPEADHPLYLATVSMFVLLFGLAYLSLAVSGRPDRFLSVLLRPQWRSWLTRGAYIITVYGGLLTAWIIASYLGDPNRVRVFLDAVRGTDPGRHPHAGRHR